MSAHLCLLWTICWERNQRAFKNVEHLKQALKSHFMHNFLDCVRHGIAVASMFVMDFVD